MPNPLRPSRGIRRQRDAGLDLVILDRPRGRELQITLRPQPGEKIAAMFLRLAGILKEHEASIVKLDIFGSLAARNDALDILKRAMGRAQWPVTWVEGASCTGDPIAGVQVLAVSGAPVETVTLNGRIIGRVFDDGQARHCLLGELGPAQAGASQADQTRQTYETFEAALQQAGLNATHVVRTWFYLDGILSWYDQFNAVRNEFFKQNKLSADSLPASTGVSGKNPAGAALVLSAWAVQPRNAAVRPLWVPSPLQCPAPEYGSAFSRALEVLSPQGRRLFVSGTASIAADGHTARIGDVQAQIALTMEVVKAILDTRSLTFSDVTRAIAYFKRAAAVPAFGNWCTAHGVALLPAIAVESDICRPELLFELELDVLT